MATIDLCVDAWMYAQYRIKYRDFSRLYVRSKNPYESEKIPYTQKYEYLPMRYRDAMLENAGTILSDIGSSAKIHNEIQETNKEITEGLTTKRVTKGYRYKQKFEAIGWYCYKCKRFYHDEEIKQWQHEQGLDI